MAPPGGQEEAPAVGRGCQPCAQGPADPRLRHASPAGGTVEHYLILTGRTGPRAAELSAGGEEEGGGDRRRGGERRRVLSKKAKGTKEIKKEHKFVKGACC